MESVITPKKKKPQVIEKIMIVKNSVPGHVKHLGEFHPQPGQKVVVLSTGSNLNNSSRFLEVRWNGRTCKTSLEYFQTLKQYAKETAGA